ncbi:MAG TPA: hypothetical protein VJH23_06700 [archaeon]|nr:hypothetical protein [archaeon]
MDKETKKFIASFASFFWPGLGQIIKGRLLRGILVMAGAFFLILLAIIASILDAGALFWTLLFVVWVWNVYDAWSIGSTKDNSNLNSKIEKLTEYLTARETLQESNEKIILQKDEKILYKDFSNFCEERAVRVSNYGGHSVRIMKGWWVRLGSSVAESHGELRQIDNGILFVTNKRFIFNGQFKSYNYASNKIVSLEPFSDAVRIAVQGRQKTLTFGANRVLLLGFALQALVQEGTSHEAEESAKEELKAELLERLKIIEGTLEFDINNFGLAANVFGTLSSCVNCDVDDYMPILKTVPAEIKEFQKRLRKLQKTFVTLAEDIEKTKSKLGTSSKKDEIEVECLKMMSSKYGENFTENFLKSELEELVKNLTKGEASLTLKINNSVGD